jgi:hypothetical protein
VRPINSCRQALDMAPGRMLQRDADEV